MSLLPPDLRVGDIRVWAVLDGHLTAARPPGLPSIDSPKYVSFRDWLRDGIYRLDVGGFVVSAGDRVVIIDAGAGPGSGGPFTPPVADRIEELDPAVAARAKRLGYSDSTGIGMFLRARRRMSLSTGSFGINLARIGFTPEDITDVLLSHLHFDHIGWVSRNGLPYFPNAVVRCEQNDAAFFLEKPFDDSYYKVEYGVAGITERVAPVLARLETWTEDAVLAPGVEARFTPGHTPGSCIFSLNSGHDTALILGDSVHCAYELVDPHFNAKNSHSSDINFHQAEASRQVVREIATRQNTVISSPHFPSLRFGRLTQDSIPKSWDFAWV